MNGKFLIRFALLLALCSVTAMAGYVDILSMTPAGKVGDALVVASYLDYTSYTGTLHTPYANPTMLAIGGYADVVGAVDATDNGVTKWTGYTTTNPLVPIGPPVTKTTPTMLAPLGLLVSDFNTVLNNTALGIANGSAVYWTVTAAQNDTIQVLADFVANDEYDGGTSMYNDFGFISASTGTGLSDTRIVQLIDSVQTVGSFSSSGPKLVTFTFPSAGVYTVAFGSMNVGAFNDPSGTLFDIDPASPTFNEGAFGGDSALLLENAPEPGTFFLAGASLLALVGAARRKLKK